MSNVLASLLHPSELWNMVDFMVLGGKNRIFPPNDLRELAPSMRSCYQWLNKTSRSFAAVIQALHPELRPAVCLFYLILRALDTVEDDMSIDAAVKIPLLRDFHNIIRQSGWSFNGNGPREKDRGLLVDFGVVISEFAALEPKYQGPIADITKRMGAGMAEFAAVGAVRTTEQYNQYCHYVAGLVGIGLSHLFSASGLEQAAVGDDTFRANSMGLFLQKTNIIRDYLEDLRDGRTWWPEDVWAKYAPALSDFAQPVHAADAVACVNHLVTDALRHVPDVFEYMSRLRDPSVFNFCAIPQTMAIATLAACYNNHAVFTRVVKIRKGEALSLMLEGTSMPALYAIFARYTAELQATVPATDPSAAATHTALQNIQTILSAKRTSGDMAPTPQFRATQSALRTVIVVLVLMALGVMIASALRA